MSIQIYNTLLGKKELFEPMKPGRVDIYVCGPTVYSSSHIGHARSAVVFDIVVRYLKEKGNQVTYVRNFTDIDDKIIARANSLDQAPEDLAGKYIREYLEDMDALYVQRPDIEPRVSDHIDPIVKLVEKLIEKGKAYAVDGDVFFSVNAFSGYGKLSHRNPEDMEAGARVEINPKKRNPLDFALWKAAKPGEPSWDSPWGKGRPGWHIECSAMSREYLGETFDIHGGGKDLIFPHHENEIAQSEAAHEKCFARYWIHNGFVKINQEKMSKSTGNFLLIKDIRKMYHPEILRFFLLTKHYRSPIDFSDDAIREAEAGLDRIYTFMERSAPLADDGKSADHGEYYRRFTETMDDDFNTAGGLGILFEAVRAGNRFLDQADPEKRAPEIRTIRNDILKMSKILGILNVTPRAWFDGKKERIAAENRIDEAEISDLVEKRTRARKEKDWATADQIRKQLDDMHIILEDRPDGTVWKIGK